MKEPRQRFGAVFLIVLVIAGFVGLAFGVGYVVGKLVI